MSTFSLQNTGSDQFLAQAESPFRAEASMVGYTQAQIDSLIPRIRDHFSSCLDQVLADAKNSAKRASNVSAKSVITCWRAANWLHYRKRMAANTTICVMGLPRNGKGNRACRPLLAGCPGRSRKMNRS